MRTPVKRWNRTSCQEFRKCVAVIRRGRHAMTVLFLLSMCGTFAAAQSAAESAAKTRAMNAFVNHLLARMSLKQKVGQLSILGADHKNLDTLIQEGLLGGTNGVLPGVNVLAYTERMQHLAMESPLKIPLWFMGDVNHGFRTMFPVPLALAATWDPGLVVQAQHAAAVEATSAGVDWTFTPMVDIGRDPRWGRVVEGAGEDPYLDTAIGLAQLRGFQGKNLAANDTMMATAKHFVGYGAVRAGREYNSVYLPQILLRDVYLPPFHAMCRAGVAAVMPALTTLNGVPATADREILTGILRKRWGYQGIVVSDFDAIPELIPNGVAATPNDAARLAFDAGVDVDLHSGLYMKYLPGLVRSGAIPMSRIDAAVRRVLDAKYELGLFANPYRYDNPKRYHKVILSPQHLALARKVARESVVLLRNVNHTLPLSRQGSIAVIGPLANVRRAMLGQMPAEAEPRDVVTLLQGIRKAVGDAARVRYARGVGVTSTSVEGIPAAVKVAKAADVAVLVVGENQHLIGEGHSRSHIGLPGKQLELVKAIVATGKPVVVVLINGRPLAIPWVATHVDAILDAWVPGDEAGPAVADLLFGTHDPSGKLPITFPRDVGQIPIYYSHLETGRPYNPATRLTRHYTTHYVDVPNSPLYRFGYGLSYTTFAFGPVHLDHSTLRPGGSLQVSVRVSNTGSRRGAEVVQMYVHDKVATISPPVRLLKGFRRVSLNPGQTKTVHFTLRPEQLAFYLGHGLFGTESGHYQIFVGGDSAATDSADFVFTKKAGNNVRAKSVHPEGAGLQQKGGRASG